MDYERPSSATTLSKKLANGGSLSGKHVYDGVFVGAAKSGSRMEDYGEIFGGSGKCSIPILDFPDLKESKSSVEARNSRPDYSKIFGGFGDADFAVPYEELFAKPKKVKSSSKGARAAAEAKFCPAEPKHSNFSGEKQAPSLEVSFQSFDGVKQFNSSYDKSNPGSENGTNGMAHIAELHAIPGNNCLIGEINPPRMMKGDEPLHAVLNDADMNINVNEGIMQRKTLRKVVSGPQPRGAAVNLSRSRADFQTKPNRNKSFSNDISFDAFETGLATEQSPISPLSSLPNFGNNRDGTIRSVNSKFGDVRGNASEIAAGSYSRPFLDAEIDADSAPANVSEGIMRQKTLWKVVSGPQPRGAAIDTSRSPADFQTKPVRNRSFSNDISFDAFEIGLGTQQSSMSPLSSLPNFGNNGDGSIRSMNSSFRVFRGDASEVAAGSYSPPFLDEEIDANSAAATSAAAVSKAIEEAKVKLKIAKELMERRKEGTANRVKPSVNRLKAERREVKTAEKANRSSEKPQEMHQKVVTGLAELEAIKANQVAPDFRNVKKSSPVQSAVGENHSREFKWTQVDHRLEPESEKAAKGFSEPADTREHNGMVLEVKLVNNVPKVKPSASEKKCEEKMTGVKNIKKPMECEKKEALEEANKQEKIERELNSVEKLFEWNVYRNNINSAEELYCQEENKEKTRVAFKDEEADRAPNMPDEQEETQGIAKRLNDNEPEENEKIEIQVLKEIENVEEPNEAHDGMKIEKKQGEAQNQEEVQNLSTEVPVREENERTLDEILRHKGNGKVQEEGLERVECEKKQQEGWIQEENKKKQNDVSKPEDVENSGQVHKQAATEVRFNDFQDEKGSEKRLRKDCGTKDNKRLEEAEQNEILNKVFQINETEKERTCERVETQRTLTGIHLEAKDENNVEATQQAFRYKENHLTAKPNVYRLDNNDTAGDADEACGVQENFGSGEVNDDALTDECNRRTVGVTEDSFPEETEKGLKRVEESNNMEEEVNFEIGVSEESLIVPDAIKKQTAHSCSGDETEYERICEQSKDFEERTSQLDGHYEYASKFVIGSNDEENESNCVSSHERLLGNRMESKTQSDPEKDAENTACKLGENNDVKESEDAINHEEDETYSESSSDEKFVNIRSKVQATQQAHIFYGEGMSIGTSEEERTNQRTDEKEKSHHQTVTVEKRGAEDILQKEVELEKEHHRRKDEVKLREMDKEKERIAVERAIREARERAFAEARERAAAERATAGTNQRVMAEARERLEKACAEANSKSAAEKASMEAKLKAERAAVERATAEARERALEKAMSEKATFKAKNQAEKSAAEKFSGASRDAVMKSSDLQSNCSGPSSSSRCTSSSSHDERFGGVNGESTERCKATLARNQRTAERAAKALAEKNMRDLLAQNEQAERNRLAETLDADVKRWSSGKERNLRALLSTLQYILGPDSGWQPIPLTDLITTAAVKKAYRKATLFVHPDKLQQRGASIQQKYTCEKVFDLLKDAWNKFSAEER